MNAGRAVRVPGPEVLTALLSAALVASAALLLRPALGGQSAVPVPVTLRWWQLVPVFALAEVLVVHLELGRHTHSFTLSEVPLVLGLLFADPGELLVARVLGGALTLIVDRRQSVEKVGFNLSLFAADGCLALAVFHALGGRGVTGALEWVAATAGVLAASALGLGAVTTVIHWHGGRTDHRSVLALTGATVMCNSSLAAVAAVLLVHERWALLPMLVVLATVAVANRGYVQLTKRYAGLDLVHQFTRRTSGPVGVTGTAGTAAVVLDEARSLLRADLAAIALCPADPGDAWQHESLPPRRRLALPESVLARVVGERATVRIPRGTRDRTSRALLEWLAVRDLLVAPMVTNGRVIGTIMVADRLGETSTFDPDDARLFTALAVQAGIAVEHGRVLTQLHLQVRAREHEALHDALTGLPNRVLFTRALRTVLEQAGGGDTRFAVLLMDLDQFKEVNDTLGHHNGDLLLQEVTRRLRAAAGPEDLVARLGGDEFAVLMPRIMDERDALELAARIHTEMDQPIRLGSLLLEIGASIGVALRPDHGDDVSRLMQRADVAMYAAKCAGQPVAVYDDQADWNSPRRLQLAGELRGALSDRAFHVRYQPIVRTDDGRIVAAEALARWLHPTFGELSPDDFIPLAERAGMIGPLTEYVLDQALADCRAWLDTGCDLRVAVNLSVRVLRDVEWPAKVAALLETHGLEAERLVFEITESGIMSDPENMIRILDQIAASGVAFSIDDFGTGYSSLAYLQQLPISEIKIDKSFVRPLPVDPGAAGIVRSVVDLARNLKLGLVAEGVEDEMVLRGLAEVSCPSLQGFHLCRPKTADELAAWLAERGGTAPEVRALGRPS
ncbi:MAG TPA: EAL domain-containing protein [Kineosporiaceae bacterium]